MKIGFGKLRFRNLLENFSETSGNCTTDCLDGEDCQQEVALHSYVGRCVVSWEIAANLFVNYTFPHAHTHHTHIFQRHLRSIQKKNTHRRAQRSRRNLPLRCCVAAVSDSESQSATTILCSFREDLFFHRTILSHSLLG